MAGRAYALHMAAARPYDSENIVVLRGLEPVRVRPGMYIGSTDARGLLHLVYEVVANSVDAHLAGTATRISVSVSPEHWVEVVDDGAGIPVTKRWADRSFLEVALTELHPGATADGHFPHVHVGPGMGLGLAVVNALSRRFEVQTSFEGRRWSIGCEQGRIVDLLRDLGPTKVRGTTVRFQPDATIFENHRINVRFLRQRLQELAWLTPTLSWTLQRRRVRTTHCLLDALAKHGPLLEGSIIQLADRRDGMGFEFVLALTRTPSDGPRFEHFVNYQRLESGTHEKAIIAAVKKVFPSLLNRLVCASHLTLLSPEFEGPTRARLHLPKATPHVRRMIAMALSEESDHRIAWLQTT